MPSDALQTAVPRFTGRPVTIDPDAVAAIALRLFAERGYEQTCMEDMFADYQHEHQAWRSDTPGLASFVSESDQERLQEAADRGLLMSLRDDHGFAGLAAATISPLFGRRAVCCMLEMFLTERLRGKGLAPAVESSFLAGQRSGADTVRGQIHAGNLPSLCTAQKLRRRPVQQEYFVRLAAY
jgi:hypothetical protein